MKLTKYITTACIAALFTDYLDFDEPTGMTKEEMYSYFGNVTSLSTFVYSQLPQDFGAIGDALRDAATDNAVYTWNQSSVYNVYNGTWSPLKTVDDATTTPLSVKPIHSWRTIRSRYWNVSNGMWITRLMWKKLKCAYMKYAPSVLSSIWN